MYSEKVTETPPKQPLVGRGLDLGFNRLEMIPGLARVLFFLPLFWVLCNAEQRPMEEKSHLL